MGTKYSQILDEAYAESKGYECSPSTKMEFVGDTIFDFVTYSGEMDKLFASRMIEVIECILSGNQFEYQAISDENYVNYITMVNMPFLIDKLDWGTSIRGAWFDEYCVDKSPYEIGTIGIIVPKNEIKIFLTDLIKWCNNDLD